MVNQSAASRPQRVWRAAKHMAQLVILALVAWGIWRAVAKAQNDFAAHDFSLAEIRWPWLVLAAASYLGGLATCWLFWHQLLCALGQQPRWRDSLKAYYVSQLGKYVPGKAMVIILRAASVRGRQVDTTVAATTVFVETLTMMAVGALLAAGILLFTSSDRRLLLLAGVLLLGAGLPTLPPVFRRLVRIMQVHRANPQIDALLARLDYRLMLSGWLKMLLGWLLLGLSLWAAIRSIPWVTVPVMASLADLPTITACTALAVVAGFVSLLPGGIGVREFVVLTLLGSQAQYGPAVAVISAVLLRLVWLAAELGAAAALYLLVRRLPGEGVT